MFAILPSSLELESLRGSRGSRGYRSRGSHHRPELYCQYCQRRFTKSYNLMVHERSHNHYHTHQEITTTSNNNYICDICGKNGFKTRDHLKQHRSQHSPGGSSNSSSSSSSSSYYYF